jgi:hypothetical protein
VAQRVDQGAGAREETFAADGNIQVEPLGMLGDRRAQPCGQGRAAMQVVEADVQPGARRRRDDVGGGIAESTL